MSPSSSEKKEKMSLVINIVSDKLKNDVESENKRLLALAL